MADPQPVSGESVTSTTGVDVTGTGERIDGTHDSEEIEEGDDAGLPSRETVCLTLREQGDQTEAMVDLENIAKDLLAEKAMLPDVTCPHQGCDHVVANNNAENLANHIRDAHRESLTSTVQSLVLRCPLQGCLGEAVYNSLPELADHILTAHQPRTLLPSFSDLSQSLSSPTQSLAGPSPAPVEVNQELTPPVAQLSSPRSQLQQNQPPPQHSSPRVESNPNSTAQAPRAYGLYSWDRTEQVGEQAEQRTRYGDPRLTAVQEQSQEQPQSQINDVDREAALVLAAMSEAQPFARTAAEEPEPTPPSEEEIQSEGQGDALEDAAGPSEPMTVTDPPFTPNPGDKCSMCLRSLPNPQKKAPEDEPSFESQWKAHVNPERNCRIPNKLGSQKDLPNRSGWIGKRSRGARDAVRDARKDYRDKNKDLFGHKFYPFDDKQPNSSLWQHDPNNDDNRESWNKPWPPAIEKRLREDAAREAEAQTEAPGPSRAAARARPTTARRRKRQAPSDNAEYRTESESDSDDDRELDVDDTRQLKRRRVGDSTYRPLLEADEADEVADSAAAPRGNARARGRTRASRSRAAAASGRGARGNRATSAAAAEPAPPPEGLRRSARQRARGSQ